MWKLESAENASGMAAARVVDYLGKENKPGVTTVNVAVGQAQVNQTEGRAVANFLVWCAGKRAAFVQGEHLIARLGVEGYVEDGGKLKVNPRLGEWDPLRS